jgi:hypothetical protein
MAVTPRSPVRIVDKVAADDRHVTTGFLLVIVKTSIHALEAVINVERSKQ